MVSEKEYEGAKRIIREYHLQLAEKEIKKPFCKSDIFGVDIKCSTRLKNILSSSGIKNVYDVERINNLPFDHCNTFLKYKNFGRKTLGDLAQIMKPYGVVIRL